MKLRRGVLLALLVASAPTAAAAQSAEEPGAQTEPAARASGRSLPDRYVDALAGSWAATGILAGATGAVGTLVGLAAGCSFDGQVGCGAGAIGGTIFGVSLGWIVGPGVGAARGAGLDDWEGLGVWALGLGTNLVVAGLGVLIGMAVDTADNTWGLGRAWGLIAGTSLGALSQVFLTPLYAVLLSADPEPHRNANRAARRSPPAPVPFVAPSAHGLTGGVATRF